MIRKIFAVCFGLLLLAVVARAETGGEVALAAYPGYAIVSSASGNGFDVFALENGEKTALCVVEDGRLTVANERAFEAGKDVKVYVDTDGESLFVGYDMEYEYITLHAVHRDGVWSDADVTCTAQEPSSGATLYSETNWFAADGLLYVNDAFYDENENVQPNSERQYAIPVGTDFDMSLGGIDMTRFPKSVEGLNVTYNMFPTGLAAPLLDEGDTLMQIGVYPSYTVLLLQKADGSVRVRVSEWEGEEYRCQDSVTLSGSAALDLFHAGDNQIFLEENGKEFFFSRTRQGRWLFTGMMDEDILNVGVDCVRVDESGGANQNDGYVYGESEPLDLMKIPVEQWPTSREEAVARLDTDAYAFVNNDNPKDRLHLREKPDRSAKSLGKFYNRTPVQILSWDGGWAHVRIGVGDANLEGYMMTRYLVRGGGNQDVRCAFETLMPLEELEGGAPIYRGPDEAAEEIGRFGQSGSEYVIGVYGDDWVIVMTWDENVGYVRRADLWEGNG